MISEKISLEGDDIMIAAAIMVKNSERDIKECLETLSWVDEIVILDGFSTDKTVEICKQYTDKIFQKQLASFPEDRQFILEKVNEPWVFSVDADMRITPELKEEIISTLKESKKYDAYYMKCLTIFLGKEIRHCGWFDPIYLRLFKKEKTHYDLTLRVLDVPKIQGETGILKNHLIHYGGDSFHEYLEKIAKRTSPLTAEEYEIKGIEITSLNWFWYLVLKPFLVFFYKYLYKRGILDGIVGFMVCTFSAISYYTSYAMLWDNQRKK